MVGTPVAVIATGCICPIFNCLIGTGIHIATHFVYPIYPIYLACLICCHWHWYWSGPPSSGIACGMGHTGSCRVDRMHWPTCMGYTSIGYMDYIPKLASSYLYLYYYCVVIVPGGYRNSGHRCGPCWHYTAPPTRAACWVAPYPGVWYSYCSCCWYWGCASAAPRLLLSSASARRIYWTVCCPLCPCIFQVSRSCWCRECATARSCAHYRTTACSHSV